MKFFHILFPLFVPNFASSIRWNPPHRLMTAGSWMVESQTIKHNTQWMLLCSCRWSSPWQRRLSLSIRIARRTNPPSVAIARSLKCHQAGRPCRSRVRKCDTSFMPSARSMKKPIQRKRCCVSFCIDIKKWLRLERGYHTSPSSLTLRVYSMITRITTNKPMKGKTSVKTRKEGVFEKKRLFCLLIRIRNDKFVVKI